MYTKTIGAGLATAGLILGFTAVAAVASPTPSTNELNQTKDWAHVNQLTKAEGVTELEFVSKRNFVSCFEYRTDGDTSEKTSDTNYNTEITDGLYPFVCVKNQSKVVEIEADEFVEVRMVFGGEKDERFDWTKFAVEPKPVVIPEEPTNPVVKVITKVKQAVRSNRPHVPGCSKEAPALGIANLHAIRTSPTTMQVEWSLHSGNDTHIIYGESGQGWKHAARNVGNTGSTEIGHLVEGRTYDFVAIPLNDCAAGLPSPVVSNR